MHPAGWRAKQVGEVGTVKSVPQVKLADFPVNGVHPGKRGAHHGADIRLLGKDGKCPGVVHRIGRLIEPGRRDGSAQPHMALVARHREQPRPQPVGLS